MQSNMVYYNPAPSNGLRLEAFRAARAPDRPVRRSRRQPDAGATNPPDAASARGWADLDRASPARSPHTGSDIFGSPDRRRLAAPDRIQRPRRPRRCAVERACGWKITGPATSGPAPGGKWTISVTGNAGRFSTERQLGSGSSPRHRPRRLRDGSRRHREGRRRGRLHRRGHRPARSNRDERHADGVNPGRSRTSRSRFSTRTPRPHRRRRRALRRTDGDARFDADRLAGTDVDACADSDAHARTAARRPARAADAAAGRARRGSGS